MNIVLHEPGIPFNTGAVGRIHIATNTALHLIRPYGFFLGDKYLKRVGIDYWQKLPLYEYDDYAVFLAQHPELDFGQKKTGRELWFATTRAEQIYADAGFGPDDCTVFSKESAGIPEEILAKRREACIRIPVWGDIRPLNLSNVIAMILYEALRQQDFAKLEKQGILHRLHWETGTEYQVLCKQTVKIKGSSYPKFDEYTG